jgi:SAM-dependent methyltransferase
MEASLMKHSKSQKFSAFIKEYDQAINWETRLLREGKFFRQIFTENNVKSVLDCASASGRHSQLFAKWGLTSIGTDVDPDVVTYAKDLANSSGSSAEFREAKLGKLNQVIHEKFDAITILGNGLAFLPSYSQLELALKDAYAVLNSSGILITQLINFDAVFETKFMPLRYHSSPGQNTLFVRYYERIDETRSKLNIIVLQSKETKWTQRSFSFPILIIHANQVKKALINSEFKNPKHYGSYNLNPFSEKSSTLLTIAHKK